MDIVAGKIKNGFMCVTERHKMTDGSYVIKGYKYNLKPQVVKVYDDPDEVI